MGWLKSLARRSNKSGNDIGNGKTNPAVRDAEDKGTPISHPGGYSELFTYTRLKHDRNFRVLRLKGHVRDEAGKYFNMPLQGSLIEASLDDPPKYFALSYCWGNAVFDDSILIDGKRLAITRSCGIALRRMMKGKIDNTIWVDAICINQAASGLEERGHQVSMMDEIYSCAERVHVHLGESDPAADAGFQAIKSLAFAYLGAIVPSPFQKSAKQKYERLAEDALATTAEFPYGKLYGVFRLPWFKRTWVVQEVALAKKAVFYCGDHLMQLTNMAAGSDFSRFPLANMRADATYWKTYLNRHQALNSLVRRKDQGEDVKSEQSLGDIMFGCAYTLQATKPEDKVFGMYGICKRLGYELPVPDYTKSLDVIYAMTAEAIVRQDQSLEILEWVEGSAGSSFGLPSWVPDFSGNLYDWSPTNPPHMNRNVRTNQAVSGSSQSAYHIKVEDLTLTVKGRRLDCIASAGLPWMTDGATTLYGDASFNTGQYAGSLVDCIGSWFDLVHNGRDSSQGNATLAAFASVLLDGGSSLELPLDTITWCLDRLAYSSKSTDLRHRHCLIYRGDSSGDLFQVGEFLLSKTMHHVMLAIRGSMWRTMFRTMCGYLGLGSYSSQAGDIVVVFHGTRTPCILRPCANGYLYVGSAYVNGIMNGEFWNSGLETNDEWFVLT